MAKPKRAAGKDIVAHKPPPVKQEAVFMIGLLKTLTTEGTLGALDQCLREFEREQAERCWHYESMQIADRRVPLTTRLHISATEVTRQAPFNIFNDRYWYVRARDVDDYLEYLSKDGSFCIIRAEMEHHDETESRRNLLTITFCRDCPLEAATSSYLEFLKLFLEKLERNGIIKEQPGWASLLSSDSLETLQDGEREQAAGSVTSIEATGSYLGRKLLTDEEWQERFEKVEEVEARRKAAQCNYEQACAWVGVPYSTFRDWRQEKRERRRAQTTDE